MILSMTGFGKAAVEYSGKKIVCESKSLNSKQLDLAVKIPYIFRLEELNIRNTVAKELERGKVDVTVYIESTNGVEAPSMNMNLLKSYKGALEQMSKELDIPLPSDWYATLLRFPDIFRQDISEDLSADEKEALTSAVKNALANLVEFRRQEGKRLYSFFVEKISNIRHLLADIEPFEAERVPKIKARIMDALTKLEGIEYDNSRFEQEMIFYIEKLDVTEEKLRLTNHLDYFIDTLDNGEGQGKKLSFIAQEMGREINTLGSKSNNSEMQKIVVRMKDELEQIKEQVLNVL